jgi:membrane protein DedA with SNARE-associated domain
MKLSGEDVVLSTLVKHSFVAILLAVVIEELGLPSPIPTDVMIVFAGTTAGGSVPLLALYFVALTLASAVGGSGLYAIVRRGGRPLVDRFGRYVHLGPEQLARAEALLARGGWWSIALGRAIPGVRYATVIACGLLKVPFARYVTAHIVGSSVYITVFLALGAVFGPAILERIHLPVHGLRLLWLLPLAIGLPFLIVRWSRRVRSRQPEDPSRRRLIGAVLLGSFAGTVALTAALSATATVAELFGASHPLNVTYALLGWLLLGLELDVGLALLLLYVVLLALLTGAAVAYYELVLPYLAPRGGTPSGQVLGLALLAFGLLVTLFLFSLFVERDGSFDDAWWQDGGPIMLLGLALGVMVYATTAVYGRALASTVVPSVRRGDKQ